ncbi:MAG: hypothetical protein ACRDZO_08325, partial [Egibacteraceae bacterium]
LDLLGRSPPRPASAHAGGRLAQQPGQPGRRVDGAGGRLRPGTPAQLGKHVAVTVDVAGVELGPRGALLLMPAEPTFALRRLGQPFVEIRPVGGEPGQVGPDGLDVAAACQTREAAAVAGQPRLTVADPDRTSSA